MPLVGTFRVKCYEMGIMRPMFYFRDQKFERLKFESSRVALNIWYMYFPNN